MRRSLIVLSVTGILALCVAATVLADKQSELSEKPWRLTDLPGFETFLDENEIEPNDTCPGNPYTLGETFHGAIDPGGDQDWIVFDCNGGDRLTIPCAPSRRSWEPRGAGAEHTPFRPSP